MKRANQANRAIRFILAFILTALSLAAANDDENRVPTESGRTISADDANDVGVAYSNKKEHDKAIYWLKQAYEKGGNETKKAATVNLGNQYTRKSPPDYKEAFKWYEIAIKLGEIDAYYNLGKTYHTELKDYPNAIKWYEEGFKKGQIDCAYGLGVLYNDRLKDYDKAIVWYEKASLAGDKGAAYALGVLYQDILKDYPNAIKWFKIAHNTGEDGAAYALGLLYDETLEDYPNAIKWYEIAHEQKDKQAAFALGLLYDDILKDYPKAIEWYQIAHKQNNQHFGALGRIGLAYLEGKGVEKDIVKARSLLKEAADGGSNLAKKTLQSLDRNSSLSK